MKKVDNDKMRARFLTLKEFESAGAIANLKTNAKWPLSIDGEKVGVMHSEFDYIDEQSKAMILEVSPARHENWPLVKKVFQALYRKDILIREI